MENRPCNPCQLELFEITPYNRSAESLIQRQVEKKNQVKIKMTTYSTGSLKNNFLDECQKRGVTEAEVTRRILKLYYDLLEFFPHLKGKEYKEIYQFLIQKPH